MEVRHGERAEEGIAREVAAVDGRDGRRPDPFHIHAELLELAGEHAEVGPKRHVGGQAGGTGFLEALHDGGVVLLAVVVALHVDDLGAERLQGRDDHVAPAVAERVGGVHHGHLLLPELLDQVLGHDLGAHAVVGRKRNTHSEPLWVRP